MEDFSDSDFSLVASQLRCIIQTFVDIHRSAGEVLTWNVLHKIEQQAFDKVLQSGGCGPVHMLLLATSSLTGYPHNDDPVDDVSVSALPTAFGFIAGEYKSSH